jgi:nicotinamidase/pyrazinamidase
MPGLPGTALLIVDVQVDFCAGGPLPVPNGDRVVPVLNRYIETALACATPIYLSRDWHPIITRHFRRFGGEWPVHCVQRTAGAKFHAELDIPHFSVIVSKGQDPARPGYSAFEGTTPWGTSFIRDLQARGVRHLFIGGLATDYCVKHSALDARRAGFKVTLLGDAIAGITEEGSVQAIDQMRQAGVNIVDHADLHLAKNLSVLA